MIGLARSSLQYRPAPRGDDALRQAIIRLAKQYGRYGCRKVTELLHVECWRVNHKKVERLWREEELQLAQRHKKRNRLYHKDSSIIRLRQLDHPTSAHASEPHLGDRLRARQTQQWADLQDADRSG
ncbi:MAG: IS3 family transposase [Pseudomonadota bacterium]